MKPGSRKRKASPESREAGGKTGGPTWVVVELGRRQQEQDNTRLTRQEWLQVNDHLARPSEATMEPYVKFLVRAGCGAERALQLAAMGIRDQQQYELKMRHRLSSSSRGK